MNVLLLADLPVERRLLAAVAEEDLEMLPDGRPRFAGALEEDVVDCLGGIVAIVKTEVE